MLNTSRLAGNSLVPLQGCRLFPAATCISHWIEMQVLAGRSKSIRDIHTHATYVTWFTSNATCVTDRNVTYNQIGGPPWRRHQGVTAQPRHLQKHSKIQHTIRDSCFLKMFWGSESNHFCASVRPSVRASVRAAVRQDTNRDLRFLGDHKSRCLS